MKPFPLRLGAALLLASLAGGCADLRIDPLPDPIRPPKPAPAAEAEGEAALPPAEAPRAETRTTRAPGVVIQRTVAEGIADRLGQDLRGDPIRVSFHDVPLVPFINEVFGEELGMSFVISPGLREKGDLVTLKLTEPLPPSQLFATARRVLAEYGVELREVEQGVLSFAPSQEIASRDVPLLVSGRALPEVPATHRVIFQLVPLHVVRGPRCGAGSIEAFDSQGAPVILEDPDRGRPPAQGRCRHPRPGARDDRGAGPAPAARAARPHRRAGVHVRGRARPGARNRCCEAEGYQASIGAGLGRRRGVPPRAGGREQGDRLRRRDRGTILDHVEQWARTLDTRQKESIEEAVFTYEVRNTQAEELMETLNQMLGAGDSLPLRSPSRSRAKRTKAPFRGLSRSGKRSPPPAASSSTRTATCSSSVAPASSGRRSGRSSRSSTGPSPRC